MLLVIEFRGTVETDTRKTGLAFGYTPLYSISVIERYINSVEKMINDLDL